MMAGAADVAAIPWHCIASGATWQAADCPSARRVALSQVSAITAPGNPTGLTGTVVGARVTLSWLGPSTGDLPTSYIIEAGSAPGRVDLANFDIGSNAPTFVTDGVPPGTYFVRVRARNNAGVSAPSNDVAVIVTGSGGCTPAAPTSLVATATGSTVTLQWTAPGGSCGATAYIVEAGSAPGLSNLANFNTGSTATTFVAMGVGAGTFYIRVRAANGANASAPSGEATLVVGGCSMPGAPAGLTGSVNGTTVSLSWGSVAGATSYVLEAGTAPGQSNLAVLDLGSATTLTATAGAGTYYVRVKAKNACGTSVASNEFTLTVPGGTCAFTVNPMTPSVPSGGGGVTVGVTAPSNCAWTAVSNASFITITSGAGGSGNGTVMLLVAPNPGATSRTGTLTIAGQTVTVSQAGTTASCTFSLSISSATLTAVGGTQAIGVTASAPTCAWTAQSSATFVTIASGSPGTGNGTVTLGIKSNGGAERTATVTIAGLSVGITQGAPLPTADLNSGCPQQAAAPTTDTSIQFINLLTNVPLTVFNPTPTGPADSFIVPPESGVAKQTKVKTIWQISTPTNPCLASYTATATPGSAIVRP
jgi:hypothetical protein